jgi:hypothetical protein
VPVEPVNRFELPLHQASEKQFQSNHDVGSSSNEQARLGDSAQIGHVIHGQSHLYEDHQIAKLIEEAQVSPDPAQGVSLSSTSHYYDPSSLYESCSQIYQKGDKRFLSAFSNQQQILGLVLKAENGKFLVDNGNGNLAWHDPSRFVFDKTHRADLTIVSHKAHPDEKILARNAMLTFKAKHAQKKLDNIVRSYTKEDRNSLYSNHPGMEKVLPKMRFEHDQEDVRRRHERPARKDWPDVLHVIDVDLSGENYDNLQHRLSLLESRSREIYGHITNQTDSFINYRLTNFFDKTLRNRSQNSTTINGQFDGDFRDHAAFLRFEEADKKVIDWIKNKEPLTLERIIDINTIVIGDNDGRRLGLRDGSYPAATTRSGNVLSGEEVLEASNNMLEWYHENKNRLPVTELASKIKEKLISIHPFSDGNGRTADLAMNWVLQEHGIPPVFIDERQNHPTVFAMKKIQYSGSKPSIYTMVDASQTQSNKFPFTERELNDLANMRKQRAMDRIEKLSFEIQAQLSELSEILHLPSDTAI